MKERARDAVSAWWRPGVCHYCAILDEQVDGDRVRWFSARRNVCSQPQCIRAFAADVDAWLAAEAKRTRRMSPGDVHARIMDELRAKRKQYREAAKARRAGKGHAA